MSKFFASGESDEDVESGEESDNDNDNDNNDEKINITQGMNAAPAYIGSAALRADDCARSVGDGCGIAPQVDEHLRHRARRRRRINSLSAERSC
jgi:hypothetical protein